MTASAEPTLKRLFRITFSVVAGTFWYPFSDFRKMSFYEDDELIRKIKNGKSIARFGDGELRIMENIPSNFFQDSDESLRNALVRLSKGSEKNVIICLPKPLKTLKGLTLKAKIFWISNIFWNRKLWKKYVNFKQKYGNTQISRPYIDYRDKDGAKSRYEKLKTIWDHKDICIVEGANTHLGEGNDLFVNAKTIDRIICPAKNAFSEYDKILKKVMQKDKNELFVISLGPTATVLAYDLAANGRQAIDIGHIDVEYEWMLKRAKKKIPISGKSVNEVGK